MENKLWIKILTTGIDLDFDSIIEVAAATECGKTFHRYVCISDYPEHFESMKSNTDIYFLEKNGVPFIDMAMDFIEFVDEIRGDGFIILCGMDVSEELHMLQNFILDRLQMHDFKDYFCDIVYELKNIGSKIWGEVIHQLSIHDIFKGSSVEFENDTALSIVSSYIELDKKFSEMSLQLAGVE